MRFCSRFRSRDLEADPAGGDRLPAAHAEDALPPITILVPAHNESATIEASVTAILTLEIPQLPRSSCE